MKLRWPWETRDDAFTDLVVQQILNNANGAAPALASATAALEACAGLVGRAFAVAEVTAPASRASVLTPGMLAMMGRALIRTGEFVGVLDVDDGALELRPCLTHTVTGGSQRSSWRYDCTLSGPSRESVREGLPAGGVIHLQYAADPGTPWRGYGPLQAASLAGRLSAEVVSALADESSGPRGQLLPIPVDGGDATVASLKADIAGKPGRAWMVEAGDWGNAGGGREASWKPQRLAANPPMAMVELAKLASAETYAACGLSESLFTAGDGAGQREAYRRALFSVAAPLGKLVGAELSAKLEADIVLDWTELRASDVSGRARAFQSLVGAGMELQQAAAVSGVLAPPA